MNETPRSIEADDLYRYAYAESRFGRLLVVMTQRGVTDVISADGSELLLSSAMARHPGAGFIPDRNVHARWVAAVVQRIETPRASVDIPYDLDAGYLRRAAG